jgi:hypothetical protein
VGYLKVNTSVIKQTIRIMADVYRVRKSKGIIGG